MSVNQGASLEETYDIRSFDNLEDALALKPEAVFVTNPNTLHLPTAIAAARAGCHLFIEKPVADGLDGIGELRSLVAEKQLTVFVGYQFRFHPGLQLLSRLVREGRLGRLAAAHIVNGEYLPDWHPYEDYRESHAARRALGGGSLRIQTHELDLAVWLFGMPGKVFAVGGHLSALEVDVEDSVSLLLECHNGARGFPVHIHLDYLQKPAQRVCEVIGDTGKAKYDYYARRVECYWLDGRDPEIFRFDEFDRNQMFMDELKHFLGCLEGEEKPRIDLDEGLRSLALGMAAERSLKTGEVVQLP